MAVVALLQGDGAVAGLLHISGLAAEDRAVCVPVLNLAQKPVGEVKARRGLGGAGNRIGVGGEHLPAEVVLHGSLHDDGHVLRRRVVADVKSSDAVRKVCRASDPELCCLLVHERRKGILRPCGVVREGDGGIRPGGEDRPVEEVLYGRHIPGGKADIGAPGEVGLIADLLGDRDGVLKRGL